ncbi:hypothetical protein JCM33374_g6173 [Metschnikowia sp. JCM 33374]|nr:hypothetical protein JCM33374_g6173 [Metschnikowia sp. JCM 33374]
MKTWPLDLLLVAVVVAHLLLAPYTKVEESFNVQAIHDILNHGVYPASVLDNYDHKSFPGVVPRTFVGSVVIAGIVKAIDFVYAQITGSSFVVDKSSGQLHVQIVARVVLGLANVWGFLALRKSLIILSASPKKGKGVLSKEKLAGPLFYTLMLLSQFHVMFYASRTLPNFVVLPLVNFGLSKLLVGDLSGLTWLAFSGAVFRLEVGVFATIIALVSSLVFGQSNVFQGLFMLAVGSIVGLALTYSVDTYFWGAATVPEAQAFFFNVIQGKSVEWGVEPYSAYFSKYIVNFFRPPHVLFLGVFGLLRDPAATGIAGPSNGPLNAKSNADVTPRVAVTHPARNSLRILAISAVLFVSVMSFQPHKEWRFIIYIAPLMTLLAGHGFSHCWRRKSAVFAYKLLILLVTGSTFVSFGISTFMAYASSYNYPGGTAIEFVNDIVSDTPAGTNITIHMDVPACMTGITHFTELHRPNIIFDKTESDHALAKIWNSVDYLITHKDLSKPLASDLVIYDSNHWDHLASVPAFAGINIRPIMQFFEFLIKKPVFRKNFSNALWAGIKTGKFSDDFTTLYEMVQEIVVLKNYLHVYKRTAPDVMPTILDISSEEEELQSEEALKKEYEKQLMGQIDPQEIQESVNEQIDFIEDNAEARSSAKRAARRTARRVADEL